MSSLMNSATPELKVVATIDSYKVDEISKEVQSDFDADVPLRFKDCQKIQAARRMRRKESILAVPAVCRFVFRP